jgi:hypothetical protein
MGLLGRAVGTTGAEGEVESAIVRCAGVGWRMDEFLDGESEGGAGAGAGAMDEGERRGRPYCSDFACVGGYGGLRTDRLASCDSAGGGAGCLYEYSTRTEAAKSLGQDVMLPLSHEIIMYLLAAIMCSAESLHF